MSSGEKQILAFIIATNNYEVLKNMDYIYLLDNGEVTYEGQYDEMQNIVQFSEVSLVHSVY